MMNETKKFEIRDNLLKSLEAVRLQIPEGFPNAECLDHMRKFAHELNLLGMGLTQGLRNSELEDIAEKVSIAAFGICAAHSHLEPPYSGEYYIKEFRDFEGGLLERAIQFVKVGFADSFDSNALQKLGIVWDQSDGSLSSGNLEACSKILSREKDLISDAIVELSDPDEDTDEYTHRALLKGKGLVKTVLALMKTLISAIHTDDSDADTLTSIALEFSSLVDDFTISLYGASEDTASIRQSAETLNNTGLLLVEKIFENQHRSKDNETKGNFLKKAFDHNFFHTMNVVNEIDMEKSLKISRDN